MIDRNAGLPRYRKLADKLRQDIERGEYGPGDLLPSQSELSKRFGLTVGTVRRAIAVLRAEGLVETILGEGVAVRRPPAVIRISSTRYRETLEALEAGETPTGSAFTHDHDVPWEEYGMSCTFRTVRAPDNVARLMGVEEGTRVFRRHMIPLVRGVAEQIKNCYYPLDLVEGTPMMDRRRQPWPGGVVAELKELGVTITRVDHDVLGRMPTPDETADLAIPDGVPVLEVTRVGWSDDRVAEVAAPIIHRADRYVLHFGVEL